MRGITNQTAAESSWRGFGPNTAAATYECDDQDLQWLESQRDAFVAENMKEKKKMNTMMKKKDQRQQGEQGKRGVDERR